MELHNLNEHAETIYTLPGFAPRIVDEAYLQGLGIETAGLAGETLAGLRRGSELFLQRLREGTVIPRQALSIEDIAFDSENPALEIHNYTGKCPTLTYEINPVKGCNVGCLYCLVTDGVHETPLAAYQNYPLLLQAFLEKHWQEPHYYYFSPKTEALQEPSLETGIAHQILREFAAHFARHPDSRARLFMASKAGSRQLLYRHEGDSILELMGALREKMQFNTSVSIMPPALRAILEPFAAPIEERMEALRLCQEQGILANSALVQPILVPYLTEERMREFFRMLRDNGVVNYKPEFLTLCMENLAMIGQISGYYDKDMERELYTYYIAPENADHRKQRGRTAPNRDASLAYIQKMMAITEPMGLSISICYWVRQQLRISEEAIPIINRNGFQCLGYQSRLLA